MGQQLAVALTPEDEGRLLAFLHESAEIEVYRSWSPAPKSVQSFSPDFEASPFYIHNKAFAWVPQFESIAFVHSSSGQAGRYYRLANTHGPLLEYSRHPLEAASPQVAGRIYWSNAFASAPSYDTASFRAWYLRVTSWLRRHATRVKHGSTEPWCLPGACRRLENEA